jgi:hypothetical protein
MNPRASLSASNGGTYCAQTDVLVIGAGPAGLALGVELKHRGLSFRILEKQAVGASWGRMPRNLTLVSPWKANHLPFTRKDLFPRHYEMSRAEFLAYLQAYAQENQLPVETAVEVCALDALTSGGFCARTSAGEFRARLVVNASGYFSNPYVPEIPGADQTNIPQIHSAKYEDPAGVRSLLSKRRGPVLIVGKRLSAGQIMIELVDAGFEVVLSHRSPIQFGAGPLGWWFLYRAFPWMERLRLGIYGSRARGNDVRMQGGRTRQLIASQTVKTYPAIRRFQKEGLLFEDGEELRPGLVIYATGFCPALAHLQSGSLAEANAAPRLDQFESVSLPGLFFLGLDGARNFQSRFLRGIRRDAALLAARIEERLLTASPHLSSGLDSTRQFQGRATQVLASVTGARLQCP